MTEPTAPEAADETAAPTDGDKPPAAPEGEPTPNSEAARYRVERNELRAERDALSERLTGYQKRECEAAVANLLDVPADLWEIGQADVTVFYDDDGNLNHDELLAAAGALIEQRPRLGRTQGPRHQNFGQYAPAPPGKLGWESVVKGQ
ncbi:hypothetical protein [Mycolicibacterium sp. 050158]|uniref:hypothetical protein n=1 Tax=Mycolicibacterium sp. 050158 TaxID=3090602 RepID=UPI00299E460C|nr:hypothetical protein [Mycolicibacterium sp. 050158]MDX1890118.1 hypothetical protein [Mycolicibacterium sp. 050158]